MRCRIWALLIAFLLTLPVLAGAQDNYFRSDVSVGYHFIGHDDEMTKVGEYESLSSGAQAEVTFDAKVGSFYFGGHGFYYDESEKEWSGYLDFARIIRTNYSYDSFIHRLQHDTLFADEDKFNGLTALNPFAWVWNGTAYELEGAQKAMHTDLDVGEDYQIYRTEHKWDVKVQVPFFPYIIPEMKIRKETRHGWRQHTFMAGKCASCHVVGTGVRVDEETTDVTLGATLKYGILTLSYFHTESHFDNDARKNFYTFDDVANPDPAKYAAFESRILYDKSYAKFAETPDVDKDTDKVKLRLDLPYSTTFYGSYVSSRVENNYTDNDYDMDTYFARLTTTLPNKKLTLSLKFRYYDIDNDDVKVDLKEYDISGDTAVLGPGYGGLPVDYWNYERKSALSRDVYEVGFDFRYRIAKGYSLRGGYTYKRVDRDNDEFKDYYNSALEDEKYLDDETTTYHIFKLALNARPFRNLTGRIAYEYYHANSPFQYHNAICYDGWYNINGPGGADPSIDPSLPTPTPYYLIFRSTYRDKDASNVPENHHNIKLTATWTPLLWLSINGNFQYTYEENDDADNNWENNSYEAGINIWLNPVKNLFVSIGYDYQRYEYQAEYCIDLFAG